MKLEGTLSETDLVTLFHQVAALKKTGILTVQNQSDIIAVTFLDGQIVATDALNEPMEEGLGQVLVSQGLIGAEGFSQALAEAKAQQVRVSQHLASTGAVGREQVLHAVRLQTYRLLLQLLDWRDGDWNLFVGDEISYEIGIHPISAAELLVRSASDLGTGGPVTGPVPDLDDRFERRPDARAIRLLGRDGEEPDIDPGVVWLSPDEARLVERTEGGVVGSSLISMVGLDEYHVRFALYRLLHLGLVHVPFEVPHTGAFQAVEAPVATGTQTNLLPDLPPTGGIATTPAGPPPARSATGALDLESTIEPGSTLGGTVGGTLMTDASQALDSLLEGSGDDDFLRDTGSFRGLVPPPAAVTPAPSLPDLSPVDDLSITRRMKALGVLSMFVDVWLGRTMSFGLLVLLVLAFALLPERNGLFFPYPWQDRQRLEFESAQRATQAAKIDRAVRTYYLLYGRFPEQLGILSNLELLADGDHLDSRGRQLEYTSTGTAYTLQPLRGGYPVPGLERTSEVAEDFLLNPEYVRVKRLNRRPLVLLD